MNKRYMGGVFAIALLMSQTVSAWPWASKPAVAEKVVKPENMKMVKVVEQAVVGAVKAIPSGVKTYTWDQAANHPRIAIGTGLGLATIGGAALVYKRGLPSKQAMTDTAVNAGAQVVAAAQSVNDARRNHPYYIYGGTALILGGLALADHTFGKQLVVRGLSYVDPRAAYRFLKGVEYRALPGHVWNGIKLAGSATAAFPAQAWEKTPVKVGVIATTGAATLKAGQIATSTKKQTKELFELIQNLPTVRIDDIEVKRAELLSKVPGWKNAQRQDKRLVTLINTMIDELKAGNLQYRSTASVALDYIAKL